MSRGKVLKNEEKAKFDAFRECGVGIREIGRRIKRSDAVIRNYVKLSQSYGKWTKRKGNAKVNTRTIGQIKKEATKNKLTASQIVSKLDLPIKRRLVQQVLYSLDNVKYKKAMKTPHKECGRR